MPKFKEAGFAPILILLILAIGLAVGVYLVLHPTFFTPKAKENKPMVVIPSPLSETQTSSSSYQNPFDESASAYSNPFTDNQNPFDNLK